MTVQEVIKVIRLDGLSITGKCRRIQQFTEGIAEATELLEKQIPKKPTYEGDGYADGHLVYDTWICPCCEKSYELEYEEYDYCPKCGQKIDWSDKP